MKIIKYIQDEIYGMSYTKQEGLSQMRKYKSDLVEHLIKCILYPNNNPYHKWIYKEFAIWLYDCQDVKFKKQRIKKEDYLNSIFASMGDDLSDARRALDNFYFQNKKNKIDPYPDFTVTNDLILRTFNVFHQIKVQCIKLFQDKIKHSVQDYGDLVYRILANNN